MDPRRRNRLLLGCVVVLGSFSWTASAEAQVIYPGMPQTQRAGAPTQPKLSPYLNLLRAETGILPNYHTYVLPRRELYQQQTRQGAQIMRLEQATMHHAGSSHGATRLPTGNGGRFQSYLHFYGWNQPRP